MPELTQPENAYSDPIVLARVQSFEEALRRAQNDLSTCNKKKGTFPALMFGLGTNDQNAFRPYNFGAEERWSAFLIVHERLLAAYGLDETPVDTTNPNSAMTSCSWIYPNATNLPHENGEWNLCLTQVMNDTHQPQQFGVGMQIMPGAGFWKIEFVSTSKA